MKNLILIFVLVFFGCTKEKLVEPTIVVVPQTQTTPTNNILYQKINGNVTTDHSYQIIVYEEVGGQFQQSFINQYAGNVFPYIFEDEIKSRFYFELTLHNFSTFASSGQGVINATVVFRGDTLFLEADENTWSKNITSPIYNF